MQTPTKQDIVSENLYEIPSCTICLQELNDDISSLNCGHVFHLGCISQHFEYRGTCPNCQKRACLKEVRTVHFQLEKNSRANTQLRSLLSSLDPSERRQVEYLLNEVKVLSEANQRLKDQANENKKESTNQKSIIQNIRQQLLKKKNDVESLRKQNLGLIKDRQGLSDELKDREKTQIRLRCELDRFSKQERQYEHFRKYKKMMTEHSQEIVKYKQQMQHSNTPPEEMVNLFYDMLLMKNLQYLRTKDKLSEFPEKLNDKQLQVAKLKSIIDSLKKDAKENSQKRNGERKRYEDLKAKYRQLIEKAKNKGLKDHDIPEMDDSQNFNAVSKNPHITEDPIIQSTLRKPLFNQTGSATFGGFGFRKKDDKPRLFM